MYKELTDRNVQDTLGTSDQHTINDKLLNQKEIKRESADIKVFLQDCPDVVCLSHLRWDFVYQRPQHLLSRFAKHGRVFFVEEPLFQNIPEPYLHTSLRGENVTVAVPHLPEGLHEEQVEAMLRQLLDQLMERESVEKPVLWYYTPMALGFSSHLQPLLTVYDCMDELSAFKFAPPKLKALEQQLFQRADLVFTGGQSLYEAKRKQHPAVHAFPSSIDKQHFRQAREKQLPPADQATIPEPRMGYCGVIDERMDLDLLAAMADARPEWQIVLVGPVVKIDPDAVPKRPNIHMLGGKSYQDLPAYLSGWEVALLPFALNESTAFISPTKTPEYLAAGKPVVSTPIRDVVRPYGDLKLVHIAATAQEFIASVEAAMQQQHDPAWKQRVERFMSHISWDQTWLKMVGLLAEAAKEKRDNV